MNTLRSKEADVLFEFTRNSDGRSPIEADHCFLKSAVRLTIGDQQAAMAFMQGRSWTLENLCEGEPWLVQTPAW